MRIPCAIVLGALLLTLPPVPVTAQMVEPAPSTAPLGMIQTERDPDLVRQVQQALRDRGYEVGDRDGDYGPATRQALQAFRRDQGLPVRSILDSEVLAALDIDWREPQEAQTPEVRKLNE